MGMYVCNECFKDGKVTSTFKQQGNIAASWGGDVVHRNGEPEWEDDNDGADVAWDVIEVEHFECEEQQHYDKELRNLVLWVDDDRLKPA